ncbi:MAG: site-2 protease family protein [Fimbriimonadaceae bacterium]|nr:site-2 protease family protein [Fimbriimonadaceae bacterium]
MDPMQVIAAIIVLFLGVGIHEYAHCKIADLAGDPTPRLYGRVTLNLTKHFEPMGTIMMIMTAWSGYGLGWGRPAPINPSKMNNPRWDTFMTVAAGPLSNVMQAIAYGILYRVTAIAAPDLLVSGVDNLSLLGWIFFLGVVINLRLAMFNLIPIGPLDGHWLVGQLLPEKQRFYWYKFNQGIGMIGLIVLILVLQAFRNNGGPDILGMILDGPTQFLRGILMGW